MVCRGVSQSAQFIQAWSGCRGGLCWDPHLSAEKERIRLQRACHHHSWTTEEEEKVAFLTNLGLWCIFLIAGSYFSIAWMHGSLRNQAALGWGGSVCSQHECVAEKKRRSCRTLLSQLGPGSTWNDSSTLCCVHALEFRLFWRQKQVLLCCSWMYLIKCHRVYCAIKVPLINWEI